MKKTFIVLTITYSMLNAGMFDDYLDVGKAIGAMGNSVKNQAVAGFSTGPERLQKLAEQGDSDAMSDLGQVYEEGNGVKKDLDTAEKWYRKAAEAGNIKGKLGLQSVDIEKKRTNHSDCYNKWTKEAISYKPKKGDRAYNCPGVIVEVNGLTTLCRDGDKYKDVDTNSLRPSPPLECSAEVADFLLDEDLKNMQKAAQSIYGL